MIHLLCCCSHYGSTASVVSRLTVIIAVTVCITIMVQKMCRFMPGAGYSPASASNKKTTVLPMTKGACKYVNPSGTPKNATAMVRITRLTRTATMIVSGPTQTSLRSAKPFREVGRVVVDAISFSFQTSQTFTAFVDLL